MKRPTMKDVAECAGVSKTTVSHVINHTRYVEESTRQRVLDAIAQLGYRPSMIARSLTTQRTQTVGALIPDIANPFFAEMVRGVEDALMPQSYNILVCSGTDIPEHEARCLELLLRQRVDGIVVAASRKWDILAEFEEQHTPVVFVDRYFEGLRGPFVGVDNWKEAHRGTSHLIACGHRHLAILAASPHISILGERLAGFRAALEEHHLALPEEWVISSPPDEGERLKHVLASPDPPTAIFCSIGRQSLMALASLRELGLRCPQDVALVGFDDPPWALVTDPPLTVISQPARQLGRTGASILLDLIDGREPSASQVILDCELIVRQSCGSGARAGRSTVDQAPHFPSA